MTIKIVVDDLRSAEIIALLTEHLEEMARHSPPESVHALDLAALRQPDVTFWSAWKAQSLVGCAALRRLDSTHAEIKSMRTARHYLRRGIAQRLLQHVVDVATTQGYRQVSLETGSMLAFAPARALYKNFGFVECKPFADYSPDPNSVFMTKML